MTNLRSRSRRPAAAACLKAAALLLAVTAAAQQAEVTGLPGALPEAKALRLEAERDLGRIEPPSRMLPPRAQALSCATPQALGTIQASHPFYDVFLDAGGGSFTARTGVMHSVTALAGSPQNVIFGGAGGGPGTSDVAWQFHVQNRMFQDPGGGTACVFDPPDTPMEPNSIGIEQEFNVEPELGVLKCTLRQEIVAFGTTEANSGIRMTLATTNWTSSTTYANVGVRWQIDYQNTFDDGPWFATVRCDPPVVEREWSLEHDLLPSEIRDFYRIQNNDGFPIFSNVSSTTAIAGIPDTSTPDRLVYGRWGSMVGSAWDYLATEGACCPDSDSAVLWYHGYLPVDGDILQPGETSRHSVVIFSSADTVDCGSFIPSCATSVTTPPADQLICTGDTAALDASGIALTDCAGGVLYTWTDGVSTWSTASIVVSPAATTGYAVAVTCASDPACRADFTARVTVDAPPVFDPPLAADPDACNAGIKLSWNDAVFRGSAGGGTYNVYRSEISCADALAQPPLMAGLRQTVFYDDQNVPGSTYFYVLEAEDATPGSPCRPLGPNGGSVTRLCTTAVTDASDQALPAGVGAVLFASRSGDEIRLRWTGVRALLPAEHLHLRKALLDPRRIFVRVNPEGDIGTMHAETDTSAWLQFFDLRAANACERESLPDYPPGWDQ